MRQILFEKIYSSPCDNMKDLEFFHSLADSTSIFQDAENDLRADFVRLAAQCALIAERLRCTLRAILDTEENRRIVFSFSAKSFSLGKDSFSLLQSLTKNDTLNICSDNGEVAVSVSFYL